MAQQNHSHSITKDDHSVSGHKLASQTLHNGAQPQKSESIVLQWTSDKQEVSQRESLKQTPKSGQKKDKAASSQTATGTLTGQDPQLLDDDDITLVNQDQYSRIPRNKPAGNGAGEEELGESGTKQEK